MILKSKKVCDEETGIVYTVIFVKESDNTLVLKTVKNQNCDAEMTVQELVDNGYSIEFQTDDNKETPIEWFRRMISSDDVKNRRIAMRFDAINGITEMGEVKRKVINAALTDPDEEVRVAAYQTIETIGWLDEGIQEAYARRIEELSEIKKRDKALGFYKLPYVKCEKKYETALDGGSLLGIVAERERVVIVMWNLKNISKEKFRKQFKARFPKYKNIRNDELNKLYMHYLYLWENQREQLKKEWDIRNSRIKKDLPEEVQVMIDECGLRVLRSDGRGTARKITPIQKKNYDCHTLSGYRLVDLDGNTVAGRKYELYEQDVYEFCKRYKEYLKLSLLEEDSEDKIQKQKLKKPHTSKFRVGAT